MSDKPSDVYKALIDAVQRIIAESIDQDDFSPQIIGFRMVINGAPIDHRPMPGRDGGHPVEIHEIGDDLVIATDISGYDPEGIQIFFTGNDLHIETEERMRPLAVIDLPDVNQDTVTMTCINGLLEITCRKDSEWSPRASPIE